MKYFIKLKDQVPQTFYHDSLQYIWQKIAPEVDTRETVSSNHSVKSNPGIAHPGSQDIFGKEANQSNQN